MKEFQERMKAVHKNFTAAHKKFEEIRGWCSRFDDPYVYDQLLAVE